MIVAHLTTLPDKDRPQLRNSFPAPFTYGLYGVPGRPRSDNISFQFLSDSPTLDTLNRCSPKQSTSIFDMDRPTLPGKDLNHRLDVLLQYGGINTEPTLLPR